MPVQIDDDRFVQFSYNPDYLQSKKWIHTITNPSIVASSLNITPLTCDLVLDGGNVIKGKSKVILTDKIFSDNPTYDRDAILKMLEHALEAQPIIIPREPNDFTGHADGIVRWYDETTVLINSYTNIDKPNFQRKLKRVLYKEGLRTIEVPYNPYQNTSYDSARGLYINYLQMKDIVIMPVFDLPDDEKAVRFFEELFPTTSVETINANQIAQDGGVLNCITWNIQRWDNLGSSHL